MPRSSGTLSQSQSSVAKVPRSGRAGPSQSQSQTQARPSGSQQVAAGPSQQENGSDDADLDQMVINMVKTILNLSANKHLIKKPDLVKNALAGNSRLFPKIIDQVTNELAEVR